MLKEILDAVPWMVIPAFITAVLLIYRLRPEIRGINAEAWDKMVLAFLAHGASTPEHLGTVLKEAPDFAMAHAVKGLFLLMLGRR